MPVGPVLSSRDGPLGRGMPVLTPHGLQRVLERGGDVLGDVRVRQMLTRMQMTGHDCTTSTTATDSIASRFQMQPDAQSHV